MADQLQWTFFGRALPERVPVSIEILGIRTQTGIVDLRVHLSQITIVYKTIDQSEDAFTVRNSLETFLRNILDIIGYERGISFDVEFLSCINSNGNWWSFGAEIPILFSRKQNPPPEIEGDTLNLFMADAGVRLALSDFREAMRMPSQTGFFCFRAVEAMMQTVKLAPEKKDEAAWVRIRKALNLDRSILDFIKKHADWARHGRIGEITDQERAQLFLVTDSIIERYLKFVMGGRVELPPAENPMLMLQP